LLSRSCRRTRFASHWRLCRNERSSCSAAQLPCCCCQCGILFSAKVSLNKFHEIQNWVKEGSYKTRIWFNQKSRSGGFYDCHTLLGLGVVFRCITLSQCIFATTGAGNFQSCRFVEALTSTFSLWMGQYFYLPVSLLRETIL